MSDPQRLLQNARDLSEPERRALEAARDVRPPTHFAGAVWPALAAKLPGAAATGVGATAAGVGATAGAGAVKALIVGAVIGVAAVGGRAVWPTASSPAALPPIAERASLEARPAPPAAMVESPSAPSIVEAPNPPSLPTEPSSISRTGSASVESAPRPTPSEAPGESKGARAAALAPTTESSRNEPSRPATATGAASPITAADAREESRLVATAREALRAGAPAQALALLEQTRLRFPAGTLLQEREALTIEALAGSGQRASAIERARAFARDNPGSPYTGRVQAILSAP